MAVLVLVAGLIAAPVAAQVVPAPAKRGGDAVQHRAQPNADEVRPGNRDGDVPSASAGDLVTRPGIVSWGFRSRPSWPSPVCSWP